MTRKLINILLILCLLTSINAVLFQYKEAKAVSAPVAVTVDIPRDTGHAEMSKWDRIAIAVWKFAVYPVVKQSVITLVTGGDFKISWDSVKNWLIHDLAFQALDATLRAYTGYGLCIDIKMNVELALRQAMAPDYQPLCRPEDSKIYDLAKTLTLEGSDEAWKKVKDEYYKSFYVNFSTTADNDLNQWFTLRSNAEAEKDKAQQHIYLELLANDGFLGKRDCSGIPPAQQGVNGENCPIMSPGAIVAESIKSTISASEQATLQATIKEDLATLAGAATQLILQQIIQNTVNATR